MKNDHRHQQFDAYNAARKRIINDPNIQINLEKLLIDKLYDLITEHLDEIKADYNESSYLYPFWQNYPPDDRGRSPIGDQVPWIEVGEHAIGAKLSRLLRHCFEIKDTGLPTGSDQRFVVSSPSVHAATSGLTDSAWLFIDIKSVGPRDDFPHTVMSPNQISGNGEWLSVADGVTNKALTATGSRSSHPFHATLPPLYVLSSGQVIPLVTIAVKPVYTMLTGAAGGRNEGQPLARVDLACVPNGLLLSEKPGYLKTNRGLLYPGKDAKTKNNQKLRARVAFSELTSIAPWRVRSIHVAYP